MRLLQNTAGIELRLSTAAKRRPYKPKRGSHPQSEVRQADFTGKQFRHNGDPERKHEENVRYADVVAARQLVRLTAYLIRTEADRKHHRGKTEENH